MAKLQDQRLSSKVAKHFSQLAEKVRNRKSDLVWNPPLGGQGGSHCSRGPQQGLSVTLFWFQVCIEALLSLPLQSGSPCDPIAGFCCMQESLAKKA